jgi:formamidopyrimidine-DNA glycosylase
MLPMPELPEVETTRRGIAPYLVKRRITAVDVRQSKLRWPIPANLAQCVCGQIISNVDRRGKYILIQLQQGTLILHLGMSGCLRLVPCDQPIQKHDHVDIVVDAKLCLRLTDPRRFGALLWTAKAPLEHVLLRNLGPEPLSPDFDADYLYQRSRRRRVAVKSFIMNSYVVVGVGNIYAQEALFQAGIHPGRAAGNISLRRYKQLVDAIKTVLKSAIKAGGTTLQDFVSPSGQPGYFQMTLKVYGQHGTPCVGCGGELKLVYLNQRSTVYCGYCQR